MSLNERQSELIDELGNCLQGSRLPVAEVLEPIMFILTDIMSQMTDRVADAEFAKDVATNIMHGYVFHCSYDESEDCRIQ